MSRRMSRVQAMWYGQSGSILMNSVYPHTAEIVEQRGYQVCAVDTSEFTKAEAAMTCMSLIVEEAI